MCLQRCQVFAKALRFYAPPVSTIEGMNYRLEMQESTGKAISVLFLLLPFGALVTKAVEYLNAPDLDWPHRITVHKPLLPTDRKRHDDKAEGSFLDSFLVTPIFRAKKS